MAEPERTLRDAPAINVPDKIDEYQRRLEALRSQTRELAQLRSDVLNAAQRDATTIVAEARSGISRILVDARRNLQHLIEQVDAIGATDQRAAASISEEDTEEEEPPSFVFPELDARSARESLQRAREEIARALENAQPEIDHLHQDASALSAASRVEAGLRPVAPPKPPPLPPPAPPPPSFLPRAEAAPRSELPTTRFDLGASPSVRSTPPSDEDGAAFIPPVLPPRSALGDVPQPTALFEPFAEPQARRQFAMPQTLPPPKIIAIAILGVIVVVLGLVWLLRSGGGPQAAAKGVSENKVPASVVAPPPPVAKSPSTHALNLAIETRRPVWLRATVDGRADEGRYVSAKERSQFAADRDVVIRAGDAGAVMVSVNGAAVEPLGKDGAVVTRRFGVDDPPRPSTDAPARSTDARAATAAATATEGSAASRPSSLAATPAPAPVPPSNATPAARRGGANPLDVPAAESELTTAAQRWLDAYYRQDAGGMRSISSPDMKVSDQRGESERLPRTVVNARRTLEGVSFQFVGDTSILTSKMTEQGDVSGQSPQFVSWVSLMWLRDSGQWRLVDVQILSDKKLRGKDPRLD